MTKEDLKKTARLAYLKLSEEEERQFASQLKLIFQYFNRIAAIDTTNTEPLVHPLEGLITTPTLRADTTEQKPLVSPEELLNLAPERLGNEYKVPPVVD